MSKFPNQNFKPLIELLETNNTQDIFRSVSEQKILLGVLSNYLKQTIEHTSNHYQVHLQTDNVMMLIADSAHRATILRHNRESLAYHFNEAGVKFNTIKIRVYPTIQRKNDIPVKRPEISHNSAESVSALANDLPQSDLKEALEKLSKKLRRSI